MSNVIDIASATCSCSFLRWPIAWQCYPSPCSLVYSPWRLLGRIPVQIRAVLALFARTTSRHRSTPVFARTRPVPVGFGCRCNSLDKHLFCRSAINSHEFATLFVRMPFALLFPICHMNGSPQVMRAGLARARSRGLEIGRGCGQNTNTLITIILINYN